MSTTYFTYYLSWVFLFPVSVCLPLVDWGKGADTPHGVHATSLHASCAVPPRMAGFATALHHPSSSYQSFLLYAHSCLMLRYDLYLPVCVIPCFQSTLRDSPWSPWPCFFLMPEWDPGSSCCQSRSPVPGVRTGPLGFAPELHQLWTPFLICIFLFFITYWGIGLHLSPAFLWTGITCLLFCSASAVGMICRRRIMPWPLLCHLKIRN